MGGYFADGTSLVGAGNALFRPPMPDPHTPNSPLPESKYIVDAGYFADGTSLVGAGNPLFRSQNTSRTRAASPAESRSTRLGTLSSGERAEAGGTFRFEEDVRRMPFAS